VAKAAAEGSKVRVSVGPSTVLLNQAEARLLRGSLDDALYAAEDNDVVEAQRLAHEREAAGRRALEALDAEGV
jgi:hypothetical protein